jgi:GT2 family glycosyltransferase
MMKLGINGVKINCGIVVPTLGTRHDYLTLSLRSIRAAGDVHICIVCPERTDLSKYASEGLFDQRVNDPGTGLATAIHAGLLSLPSGITYANWLGDDDLLRSGTLIRTSKYLDENPEVVMVFGSCDYIDQDGVTIWRNRSGQWAVPMLRFGPCLIPQPGALMRLQSYKETGGLDASYKWAFDFDLFLRLSKSGKLKFMPETLSAFRWHDGSLSVGGRHGSVREASRARRSHLPPFLKPISPLWEIPVRLTTKYAALIPQYRARHLN